MKTIRAARRGSKKVSENLGDESLKRLVTAEGGCLKPMVQIAWDDK